MADFQLPRVTETHPRWWVALCGRFGQHPGDPDAFWQFQPDRLRRLVGEAKAEHGEEVIEVEVDDLGF